jgi:hypothetical protein
MSFAHQLISFSGQVNFSPMAVIQFEISLLVNLGAGSRVMPGGTSVSAGIPNVITRWCSSAFSNSPSSCCQSAAASAALSTHIGQRTCFLASKDLTLFDLLATIATVVCLGSITIGVPVAATSSRLQKPSCAPRCFKLSQK